MLEQRIRELKAIIAANDGRNAADVRFARAVDDLLGAFYDDICHITDTPSRALFELFVIKVLYVGRRSRHADVIDYIAALLDTFLYARELFPPDAQGRPGQVYFSDLLSEERRNEVESDRFEAYRRYGDSALFLSGIFHQSLTRRRRRLPGGLRREEPVRVDTAYYVSTGRTMYRMASRQDGAEAERQRETLGRLARFFEVYVEALNEMSTRYIMGFDLDLLANKMLDSINAYRQHADQRALGDARRYAAILQLDAERYPSLFEASTIRRDPPRA
jgi:hypothetical protein